MVCHRAFNRVPQEVLEHIAFCLGSDNFLGPPTDLVPLLLTNRQCYARLSLPDNPHVYARIFRSKFDTAAAHARFGRDRLTPCVLAEELRKRCIALRRLRARLDSTTSALQRNKDSSKMSVREVLFTAYVLILEDEGKNLAQLQEYGRIHDWIKEFWFDPRGSSLTIYTSRTGVWPLNRTETALGMWLFWFLFKPEDYRTSNNSALESPLHILKAMAFGAHNFNLTSKSWLYYDAQPGQDVDHFTLYSQKIGFTPPPLAIPAILAYFSLSFPSEHGRLAPIAPYGAPLPHPAWKEWDLEWERCSTKSKRDITACFRPGSVEGVWEGFFSYTDFEVYASLLAGAPPSVVQRSIVGRHKQTWKLREYHLLSEDLHESNPGINIDRDLEPLPGGDPLNSYFPEDLQIRETWEGLTIQHLHSNKKLVYHKSRLSPRSPQNSGYGNPSRKVHDIIIAGEGHSAWGHFKLIGRVRPCDGFVSLLKDYSNGARGQWLYRAYLVGNANGTLAGRWRDTLTPAENLGYEGCFIMCRRR